MDAELQGISALADSGCKNALAVTPENAAADFAPYLRVLEAPARDTSSKLLRAGTPVLFNPVAPDEIREDNAANRRDFQHGSYTWSLEARHQAWFGGPAPLPPQLLTLLDQAKAAREKFTTDLDLNIFHATEGMWGQPLPSPHPPAWAWLLPWEPKVRRIEREVLTEQLDLGLHQASGGPADLPWPPEWKQGCAGTTDMSLYRLVGMGRRVDVVVAFVTPIILETPRAPRIGTIRAAHLHLVAQVYNQWLAKTGRPAAEYAYFSIGAPTPWPPDMQGSASAGRLTVLAAPSDAGNWNCRVPPRYGDRRSIRDFMDRLKPETRRERTSRIKTFLDEKIGKQRYEGHIFLQTIQAAVPSTCTTLAGPETRKAYRQGQILLSLAEIQAQGAYSIYKSAGQYAIGPATGGKALSVRPGQASFLRQACVDLGVVAVPQLANLLLYTLGHGNNGSTFMAVGASVVGGYTAQVLQRHFNEPQPN